MLKRLSIVGVAVALLMLVVVPASAGRNGTDRPFKANLVGEIVFDFEPEEPCPGPRVFTDSAGTATHMGRVDAIWDHCAGPQTGGGITDGTLTMTAANGDQLVLVYGPTPLPPEPTDAFVMDIVSGTGRFADADGTLVVTFGVEPRFLPGCTTPTPDNNFCIDDPWPWSGLMTGRISY